MTDAMCTNLYLDAPHFIAEALKVATGPLSLDALVDAYDPPRPNDMRQLLAEHRSEDVKTNDDVKREVLSWAVGKINDQNTGAIDISVAEKGGAPRYALAEGVDADTLWIKEPYVDDDDELRVKNKPLIARPVFTGLFDAETGRLSHMTRQRSDKADRELRESMEANGWLPELPAIVDEHGVCIVGNSRIAIAEELGIEPRIKTVRFGDGEAADARRFALWQCSNIGAQVLSPADRKAVAQDLYGQGWSMQKIAELIKVSTMTVSRDLRGLTGLNPPPERGGRPRKSEPEEQPEPQEQADADDADVIDLNGHHQSPRIKRRGEAWEREQAERDETESPDDDDYAFESRMNDRVTRLVNEAKTPEQKRLLGDILVDAGKRLQTEAEMAGAGAKQ